MSKEIFRYLVEGQCEKKLVEVLKTQKPPYIRSGKVDVVNVVQQKISEARIRNWPKGVIAVLIFDMDKTDTSILEENIRVLQRNNHVGKVYCIPQLHNLEEEIERATNIKSAPELFEIRSISEFKTHFIVDKDLMKRLEDHRFDFPKMWAGKPEEPFAKIGITNDSDEIRMR